MLSLITDVTQSKKQLNSSDEKEQILNRIISMKDNDGLNFSEIADKFNREGLKTLSGRGKWHRKTISRIYNNLE